MIAPALSAVGSAEELHLLNIIILVVSVLSALGSAWMILSFVVSGHDDSVGTITKSIKLFKSARSFRHQLIL